MSLLEQNTEQAAPPKGGRNRAIEFYRFLFAVIICLYHFRMKGNFGPTPVAFIGGYLGVEFFALVSGFFLMPAIEKASALPASSEREVLSLVGSFTLRRFARLYPQYILISVSFLLMRMCYLHTLTPTEVLVDGFFDFTLLQAFGFPTIIFLFWFPSALFIASVLLYWLALVLRQHFTVATTFAALFIVACFYEKYGTLDGTLGNGLFFVLPGSQGLWRLIAELSLGALAYQLVKYLKPLLRGRFALLSTLAELAILALVVRFTWQVNRDQRDFIVLALLFVLLLSVAMGQSFLTRLLDNPVSGFLGKISYGYYLNQCFFLHLYGSVLRVHEDYWPTACFVLVCNLVLSTVTFYLSQGLTSLLKRLFRPAP